MLKKGWYGDSLSVMFVQATPGSVLKLEIDQIIKAVKTYVRAVERGGRTVKSLQQKSDVQPLLKHCCHSGLIFLSQSEFRPFAQ